MKPATLVLALAACLGPVVALVPRRLVTRMVLDTPAAKGNSAASGDPAGPWAPDSWRGFRCEQIPEYPDQEALGAAESDLRRCAPLVFAGEMRDLQARLAEAQAGRGFLLMGGDCAESFDEFSTDHVRDTLRVLLQMALVITYGSGQPVTKIGRMAGQFAKPRTSPTEKVVIDGVETEIASYKGDNINSAEVNVEARKPNPYLMVKAYHQCAQTLNILRAFTQGGYADLARIQAWNLDAVKQSEQGSKYRLLAAKVEEALRFMRAIGIDTAGDAFRNTDFYTAHECLLLPYEEALTRLDSTTNDWYDCSAHMLWVGERTRQLDCGHLQFVRGIKNPIGVKISDKCKPDELLELLDIVNPDNLPGRVTLVIRMGADKVREGLPPLVKAVRDASRNVLWISDPVHGNTITAATGKKTRLVSAILAEIQGFFDVHRELGTHPGGVHLEMTGEDVTECLGGDISEISEAGLDTRYTTHCDPRLNALQALEIAFQIAERFRTDAEFPELCDGELEDCTW